MSRGYGSTFGGAAFGEQIQTNNSFVVSTAYSFSCWLYAHGTGQSGNGLVFAMGSGNTTIACRFDSGNPGNMAVSAAWSTARGNWIFPSPSSDAWHHFCISYSGSSTSNTPAVYIDGVAQSVTLTTPPTGTFGVSVTTVGIGNAPGISPGVLWNGMLAHAAFWRDAALNTAQIGALAAGTNPMLIRPDALVMYVPLTGINNPEFDLKGFPASVVTGTRLGTSEPPAMPTIVAYQQFIDSALTLSNIIMATMRAYQGNNFSSISISEVVRATVTAVQNADFATINLSEVIAATITAVQNADFGNISLAEVIAASVVAAQAPDFGAITLAEVMAAAIIGWQRADYATISADEVVASTMRALQNADFANISQSVIIRAWIDANQQADYIRTIVPVTYGIATLSDQLVNNSMLVDSLVYTAAATDSL